MHLQSGSIYDNPSPREGANIILPFRDDFCRLFDVLGVGRRTASAHRREGRCRIMRWGSAGLDRQCPPGKGERTVSRTLSALQALLLGVVVLVGGGLIAAAVFAVGNRQWFGPRALTVQSTFANIQGVEVGTRVR